jgi:hypothetical protein
MPAKRNLGRSASGRCQDTQRLEERSWTTLKSTGETETRSVRDTIHACDLGGRHNRRGTAHESAGGTKHDPPLRWPSTSNPRPLKAKVLQSIPKAVRQSIEEGRRLHAINQLEAVKREAGIDA